MAKQRLLLITAGAVLVCFTAMLSVASQLPAFYSPFSIPVLVPSVILSMFELPHILLIFLGAAPLTICYVACMLKGSKDCSTISNTAVLLITFTALVSVIFNALWLLQGVAEHGWFHVIFISLLNVMFILSLPISYWQYLGNRSLFRYLGFYTLYFVWLGFCAFPWYGQS